MPTYLPNTKLAQPALGERGWDAALNSNVAALEANNGVSDLLVTPAEVPSASLNVRVAPGVYRANNGSTATFAGAASQAITANSTRVLYLDGAGTLQVASSYPATSTLHIRLATVAASASTITSITDDRVLICMPYPQQAGGAATAGASYTSNEAQMLNTVYTCLRTLGFLS